MIFSCFSAGCEYGVGKNKSFMPGSGTLRSWTIFMLLLWHHPNTLCLAHARRIQLRINERCAFWRTSSGNMDSSDLLGPKICRKFLKYGGSFKIRIHFLAHKSIQSHMNVMQFVEPQVVDMDSSGLTCPKLCRKFFLSMLDRPNTHAKSSQLRIRCVSSVGHGFFRRVGLKLSKNLRKLEFEGEILLEEWRAFVEFCEVHTQLAFHRNAGGLQHPCCGVVTVRAFGNPRKCLQIWILHFNTMLYTSKL